MRTLVAKQSINMIEMIIARIPMLRWFSGISLILGMLCLVLLELLI